MTEKKRRKKIAKLAVKIFIKHGSLDGNPSFADSLRAAEFIENKIQAYINEASEPEPSTEQIEPKADSPDLSWAKWVATDMTGDVYAYESRPYKVETHWLWGDNDRYVELTPDEAIALCGRVPKWADSEPTPIYK